MKISVRLLTFALAILAVGPAVRAGGVPRKQCFPVEELPPPLRAEAERVLLEALDREALFTLVGGLKPVSEGFWSAQWEDAAGDGGRVDETRRVLRALRCGDAIHCDVLVFAATADGKRTAHAYAANAASVRAKIAEDSPFWLRLGITPHSHPAAVLPTADRAAPSDRFRGFGYAFGYPRYAVDFFVAAAESEERTGRFVPRDFVNVPTFTADRRRFIWAVPEGHREVEEDRAVRAAAAAILAAYRQRRAHYIGAGKPGVVALMRDWYDDGTGMCDPANASFAPFVPPELIRADSLPLPATTGMCIPAFVIPDRCGHPIPPHSSRSVPHRRFSR